MERIHPEGVFEAVFAGETEFFPYLLVVTLPDGRNYVTQDPYRFPPVLTDTDLRLLHEAEHTAENLQRLYATLGAHPLEHEGIRGIRFVVWAPNAARVSVIGDFNRWDGRLHSMRAGDESGLWEIFIPGLDPGALYKYEVQSRGGIVTRKADPYGLLPNCALAQPRSSRTWTLSLERFRLDDRAQAAPETRFPRLDLRSPPRLLDARRFPAGQRLIAGLPIANWPRSWCRTQRKWVTRTLSSCPLRSILWTARGATRLPDTLPLPPGTGILTISGILWIPPTRPGWA